MSENQPPQLPKSSLTGQQECELTLWNLIDLTSNPNATLIDPRVSLALVAEMEQTKGCDHLVGSMSRIRKEYRQRVFDNSDREGSPGSSRLDRILAQGPQDKLDENILSVSSILIKKHQATFIQAISWSSRLYYWGWFRPSVFVKRLWCGSEGTPLARVAMKSSRLRHDNSKTMSNDD